MQDNGGIGWKGIVVDRQEVVEIRLNQLGAQQIKRVEHKKWRFKEEIE